MTSSPPSLYGLADADALGGADHVPEAAEAMASAGIEWIQLRLKHGDDRDRLATIEETLRRLADAPVTVWINDRPDLLILAASSLAPGPHLGRPHLGLHLGQSDLPPSAARRILPEDVPIGLSCHDLDQIREAESDAAVQVVAFGPIFDTRSKASPDPTVGLAGLRDARAATTKPLVAIGGIDRTNAREVLAAGADSVAVLGGLCRHGDVGVAARQFLESLDSRFPLPVPNP